MPGQRKSKASMAVQLYQEGKYIWEIAKLLDTTEAQVIRWLGL